MAPGGPWGAPGGQEADTGSLTISVATTPSDSKLNITKLHRDLT